MWEDGWIIFRLSTVLFCFFECAELLGKWQTLNEAAEMTKKRLALGEGKEGDKTNISFAINWLQPKSSSVDQWELPRQVQGSGARSPATLRRMPSCHRPPLACCPSRAESNLQHRSLFEVDIAAMLSSSGSAQSEQLLNLLFADGFMNSMTTCAHPFLGGDTHSEHGVWGYEDLGEQGHGQGQGSATGWQQFVGAEQGRVAQAWATFMAVPFLDAPPCVTCTPTGTTPGQAGWHTRVHVPPYRPSTYEKCEVGAASEHTLKSAAGTVNFGRMRFTPSTPAGHPPAKSRRLRRVAGDQSASRHQAAGKGEAKDGRASCWPPCTGWGRAAAADALSAEDHRAILRATYLELVSKYSAGILDMLGGSCCSYHEYYIGLVYEKCVDVGGSSAVHEKAQCAYPHLHMPDERRRIRVVMCAKDLIDGDVMFDDAPPCNMVGAGLGNRWLTLQEMARLQRAGETTADGRLWTCKIWRPLSHPDPAWQ